MNISPDDDPESPPRAEPGERGGDPGPGGPRPVRRQGRTVVITAAVGVLALAAGALALTLRPGGDLDHAARTAAQEAGQSMRQAAGVAYTGTYAKGRATFTVTKAGSATGSYTTAGVQVSQLDLGAVNYLKADAAFWRAQANRASAQSVDVTDTDLSDLGGTWVRAPGWADHLDPATLSPARIGQDLLDAQNTPKPAATVLDGTPAIKINTGQTNYYLSRHAPHRLLRIEGQTDNGPFAFDVKPLDRPAMTPVFTALRADIPHLENAHAPAAGIVRPQGGGLKITTCDTTGCKAKATVFADASDNSFKSLRIAMTARLIGDGRTLATCTAHTTAAAGQNTTLTCLLGGATWSSWYRSRTSKWTVNGNATYTVTVNSAADIHTLLNDLTREEREG